ncbi:MAG TPA: NAD(P)H-binding protein [Verrucomicrobiae bacterium]|jgi:NADH dehydrogenase|nr:NAD(P)H-binding protein [Verrucomicrobiae bacterium]
MRVAITGAYGYSGRYVALRCLAAGHEVITLTNSPARENSFAGQVTAFPLSFDNPERLAESLRGAHALINTYWVRFNHELFTHEQAVANTKILFEAARRAGVRRIVHVSITNPDIHSELSYFRGKAELEAALVKLGVSYCILRPAVLFGREDVLVNNIAWALRRLPVYGVFGRGDYRLQPIHVDDLAASAVERAFAVRDEILNAIGPETFTYRGMVEMIARTLGLRRLIIGLPPALGYLGCQITGAMVHDVVITKDEIAGLMQNRLWVDAPPLGTTKLTEWAASHKQTLGKNYTSELSRRLDRASRYKSN